MRDPMDDDAIIARAMTIAAAIWGDELKPPTPAQVLSAARHAFGLRPS